MNIPRGGKKIARKIMKGGGFILDFAKWLVIIIVALLLVHTFVTTVFVVDGNSMDPTVKNGEVAVLNKLVYELGDPKRGDIVVIKFPGDPESKRYVKRVIGIPNDNIEIKSGYVYLNGQRISERYLEEGTVTSKDGKWNLGKDDYFLMGDNRNNSNDSRYFGQVEKRFIMGKTVWILLPRFMDITTQIYL